MKKSQFLVVMLLLCCMPTVVFAGIREQKDRFEFGLQAGVGFYKGPNNPVADVTTLHRVQAYDALRFAANERATFGWPGIETFGASLGYRFDTHWHIRLHTSRQRMYYAEYDNTKTEYSAYTYYNAMWHVDAIAEYNILNYTNVMRPDAGLYNVVPYVGIGLGVTMYNQNATLRSVVGTGGNLVNSTFYPKVGGKDNPLGVAMYIPLVCGVKWRIDDNVQLKGTFQYQMYVSGTGNGGLNSNLGGGCPIGGTVVNGVKVLHKSDKTTETYTINATDRPVYNQLTKYAIGHNHNFVFSLSVIVNLGKWYEDRLITY